MAVSAIDPVGLDGLPRTFRTLASEDAPGRRRLPIVYCCSSARTFRAPHSWLPRIRAAQRELDNPFKFTIIDNSSEVEHRARSARDRDAVDLCEIFEREETRSDQADTFDRNHAAGVQAGDPLAIRTSAGRIELVKCRGAVVTQPTEWAHSKEMRMQRRPTPRCGVKPLIHIEALSGCAPLIRAELVVDRGWTNVRRQEVTADEG